MAKKLMVEREIYVKNDRQYYSYFVRGMVRGTEYKVLMCPPDNGGYNVLNIVFGEEMAVELKLKPYEIKDEKTHKVISGYSFEVSTTDSATGEVFSSPIKPLRVSDKSLLLMMLR